jgi:hypothetical protein
MNFISIFSLFALDNWRKINIKTLILKQNAEKLLNDEFPRLNKIVRLPKAFIMTEMNKRFGFRQNKVLVCIDENIQNLYTNILIHIDELDPFLLLTGLGGIGKSTVLFAVQSPIYD